MLRALVLAVLALPCSTLEFQTLRLPATVRNFDPQHWETKGRLMSLLGAQAMDVEPLATNAGLNGGVWILSDPFRKWDDLIIKLRLAGADNPLFPTEQQQLARLAREHPELSLDPALAFPSKIIACSDAQDRNLGDIIVARRAPGKMLAYFIVESYYGGDAALRELDVVFENIGRRLRAFHDRYGKQHCDFHTANVIVDSTDNHGITFIDLAGMGSPGAHNDIAHFQKAIRLLQPDYPPASLLENGLRHFERGYHAQPNLAIRVPDKSDSVAYLEDTLTYTLAYLDDTLTCTHCLVSFALCIIVPYVLKKYGAEGRKQAFVKRTRGIHLILVVSLLVGVLCVWIHGGVELPVFSALPALPALQALPAMPAMPSLAGLEETITWKTCLEYAPELPVVPALPSLASLEETITWKTCLESAPALPSWHALPALPSLADLEEAITWEMCLALVALGVACPYFCKKLRTTAA